jgi:hypothetical protein
MALDARADENRQLEHVKEDLHREFAALSEAVIDEQVSRLIRAFTKAPVRSFVPVLVRRKARESLRQLA